MKNEIDFLLLCAPSDVRAERKKAIAETLGAPLDWRRMLSTKSFTDLLPLVFYNIKNLDLLGSIPEEHRTKLEYIFHENLKRNLILENEFLRIATLAYEQKIELLPLKGICLIQTLYKNPALRVLTDIDILIKKAAFKKAENLLFALGYKTTLNEPDKEKILGHGSEILFSKINDRKIPVFVEIHPAIVPARPYKINFPFLWERAVKINAKNIVLSAPSPEDNFLILALHIRRNTRTLPLKLVLDILEIIKNERLDWRYIQKSAYENHMRSSILFCLFVIQEILKCPLPETVNEHFPVGLLKKNAFRLCVDSSSFFKKVRLKGYLLRLLLFDNFSDIFVYLWSVLFLEKFLDKKIAETIEPK